MVRNTEIQRRVEDAMESLNGLEPAMPPSFFYTRVMARIGDQKGGGWDSLARTMARPAVAYLSIVLVLMLNVFIVLSDSRSPQQSDIYELAMVDEYNPTSSYYEIENVQP